MAGPYRTPGVYVEEISKFPPSIAQVETAIPAFIGFTKEHRKGGEDLLFKPTRISSMLEYEKFFGGPQKEQQLVVEINQTISERDPDVITDETVDAKFDPANDRVPSRHIMFYALQSYFANGGGPCYIVSIGKYLDNFGQPIPLGEAGAPSTFFIRAFEELRKEDEPTLYVAPEAQGMDPGDHASLIQAMLQECTNLQDRFVIADFHDDGTGLSTAGDVQNAATTFRNGLPNQVEFTKYGAAYFPNIRSVFNYDYDPATVLIKHNRILADGTVEAGANNDVLLTALTDQVLRSKAELAIDNFSINLPPSAAMAGIYARVDNLRGVWKAPANESLFAVNGLTFKVTNEIQNFLNVDTTAGKSINAIRAFTGKGILVWGARTMAGNDNEWRYISVRRFFNMVEESTKKATERFVFEPNDANTWVKVRAMIENFLTQMWNAGALQGSTPEQAFFVKVGLGETMTALDILEGRMNVEIGMAVVRPAEFIILKFSHKMPEA